MIGKLAEPPPPKGVSLKEWDRHLQKGGRLRAPEEGHGYNADRDGEITSTGEGRGSHDDVPIQKVSYPIGFLEAAMDYRPGKLKDAGWDVDDIESGDPTRLNPRLRQIHKLSTFPSGAGPEDWDALKQPPNHGKEKEGFLATLHPNAGETGYDPPKLWRPGKLKHAAGVLPSMSEQFYMGQLGGEESGESMPLEMVGLAGPQAAQGAQMANLADRMVQKKNRQLAEREGARQALKTQTVLALAKELMALQGREKVGFKLQGHTEFQGLPIAIENRKGSVRKGKDRDGNEWRTKMVHPYGYIKRTKGADGEGVDVFVGPDKESPHAFVVHQKDKETGEYDEDKVMLGFRSKKQAKEAFLAHYDSPKFLGPISKVSVERLRELVASKKQLTKISAAQGKALLEELMAIQKVGQAPQQPQKRSLMSRVRQAGPGVGGLLGAGIGAYLGRKRGKTLSGAIHGLGTGATLGWIPGMTHDVKGAVSR